MFRDNMEDICYYVNKYLPFNLKSSLISYTTSDEIVKYIYKQCKIANDYKQHVIINDFKEIKDFIEYVLDTSLKYYTGDKNYKIKLDNCFTDDNNYTIQDNFVKIKALNRDLNKINKIRDNRKRALLYYAYFISLNPIKLDGVDNIYNSGINNIVGYWLCLTTLVFNGEGIFIPEISSIEVEEKAKRYQYSGISRGKVGDSIIKGLQYKFDKEEELLTILDKFVKEPSIESNIETPIKNSINLLRLNENNIKEIIQSIIINNTNMVNDAKDLTDRVYFQLDLVVNFANFSNIKVECNNYSDVVNFLYTTMIMSNTDIKDPSYFYKVKEGFVEDLFKDMPDNKNNRINLDLEYISSIRYPEYRAILYYIYFITLEPIVENEFEFDRNKELNRLVGLYFANACLISNGKGIFLPDIEEIINSREYTDFIDASSLISKGYNKELTIFELNPFDVMDILVSSLYNKYVKIQEETNNVNESYSNLNPIERMKMLSGTN